ncbi:hypothetical protein GF380_03585 [Candidatus Uhrbacteria bacterium]|nr:hypothetical protein [Candidatus Uhrbacteria bacterium]MBD3284200.1 hypothetical protein [Candidatus Uhrbacteria bacterium]
MYLEGVIEIVGITVGTIGKLLIAWTAIAVHRRMILEHKIDEAVFQEMIRERRIAIVGVICLVVGWGFEILPIAWILAGIV